VPATTERGRVAIVPAVFDPPTNGHLEVVRRAAQLFDNVVVAVAATTAKQTLFAAAERLDLVRAAVDELGLGNVQVRSFESQLIVDVAREEGAVALVKGLRAVSDFDYELQMSHMNARLAPEIATIAVLAGAEHTFLSSTLVREVAQLGGDVSEWVPKAVAEQLRVKFGVPRRAGRATAHSALTARATPVATAPVTIMDAAGGADRMGGFVAQDERVR
jgi:pantetheine-phosphate adenylyltransferase